MQVKLCHLPKGENETSLKLRKISLWWLQALFFCDVTYRKMLTNGRLRVKHHFFFHLKVHHCNLCLVPNSDLEKTAGNINHPKIFIKKKTPTPESWKDLKLKKIGPKEPERFEVSQQLSESSQWHEQQPQFAHFLAPGFVHQSAKETGELKVPKRYETLKRGQGRLLDTRHLT